MYVLYCTVLYCTVPTCFSFFDIFQEPTLFWFFSALSYCYSIHFYLIRSYVIASSFDLILSIVHLLLHFLTFLPLLFSILFLILFLLLCSYLSILHPDPINSYYLSIFNLLITKSILLHCTTLHYMTSQASSHKTTVTDCLDEASTTAVKLALWNYSVWNLRYGVPSFYRHLFFLYVYLQFCTLVFSLYSLLLITSLFSVPFIATFPFSGAVFFSYFSLLYLTLLCSQIYSSPLIFSFLSFFLNSSFSHLLARNEVASLECSYHNTITRNPFVSRTVLSFYQPISLSFFLTHIKCSEIRALHFTYTDWFVFHFFSFHNSSVPCFFFCALLWISCIA